MVDAGRGGAATARGARHFEPPRLNTAGIGRITRATAEAEEIAAAREAGRAEERAALAAVRAEHEQAIARLDRAAMALTTALDQIEHIDLGLLHDFEQQVLSLACAIAEEVVGREVSASDDVVLESVRRALSMAPDRGDVVVRVAPADLGAVLDATSAMGHRAGVVQVVPDVQLAAGGCIAEVGPLRIDAQLPGTFARIRESFGL